jgi:mannose/fructose/N-acetylgalactosamine-specific phosphotransferase system component IIB
VNFSLVRVDNRLIHGQILEAWVPHVQASCLVVADDEVANDFFRETVIRMAVPRNIDVHVHSVDEIPKIYSYNEETGRKTILLFSRVKDARKAFEEGFHFVRLNIGNVYNEAGSVQCARSINLNDQDINDLLELTQRGVQVDLRCVPKDRPMDLVGILKKSKYDIPVTVQKGRSVVS